MKITNLTASKIFLGFIEPHGAVLPASGSVILDDGYATHGAILELKNAAKITVGSFSVGDEYAGESFGGKVDYVSSAEFNALAKGFYVVPATWSKSGVATATATSYKITGTAAGPFDTSTRNTLKFKFDSLNEVIVNLPKGQIGVSAMISALNADTTFAKYGVASLSVDKLRISSKALGTNSKVEILAHANSCQDDIAMTSPVIITPTGTVITVTIPTHNSVGAALVGISHDIKLYRTDFGGGSVVSTEYVMQRIIKGTANSGLNTAQMNIATDSDGIIQFEVAAPGAITEAADWAGVVVPATHYFAIVPATRLQLV